MFKKAFKKLGIQITVFTVAAVALLVVLLMAITIWQFRSYSNNLLQERSNSGERVLEAVLSDELITCHLDQIILTKDTKNMLGSAASNAISGKKTKSKTSAGQRIVKNSTSAATRTITRELTRDILGTLIK